ncbi:MAG: extracellular solute-binding protein [Thermoanaerobaculum sp.]
MGEQTSRPRSPNLRASCGLNLVALAALSALGCQGSERAPTLSLLAALPERDVEVLQAELETLAPALGPASVRVQAVPVKVLEESVGALASQGASSRWDVAIVPSTWLGRLHQRQAILEVPAYQLRRLQTSVSPLALLAVTVEGTALAYPFSVDVPALFYNPRYFPQSPASLAEILAAHLPAGVLPLGLDLHDPNQVFPLFLAPTGAKFGATKTAEDAAYACMRLLGSGPDRLFLWRLWTEPFAGKAQAQFFAEGRLAALVGGPQLLRLFETLKVPYAIASLPPSCSGCEPPRTQARVAALVVNSLCPYPDLAQRLALALASPERNLEINVATNTLPVVGSAEESQILAANPSLFRFQRVLDTATLAPLDEASEVWEKWERAISAPLAPTAAESSPRRASS